MPSLRIINWVFLIWRPEFMILRKTVIINGILDIVFCDARFWNWALTPTISRAPLCPRVSRVCFDGITFLYLHILLVLRRWDCIRLQIKHCLVLIISRGGGNSRIKVMGMLVVSFSGVNCRFLCHLGCLGWKVTIFAHSGIASNCA